MVHTIILSILQKCDDFMSGVFLTELIYEELEKPVRLYFAFDSRIDSLKKMV